jgi:hypothetical protein
VRRPELSRTGTPSGAAAGSRGLAAAVAALVLALTAGVATAQEPAAVPDAAQEPTAALVVLRRAQFASFNGEAASGDVRHVANWAVHSGDTGGLPFVIVDKLEGQVFVFDAEGRLRGSSAALVGSARGDESVPGIGNRPISSILPGERTTPAGRFKGQMGRGPKGEDILWIDYEGALALHRVVTGVPKERRLQRLESKVAADRRITYGCINVPAKFYDAVVLPTLGAAAGIVYILPELRRPQEVFGSYDVMVPTAAAEPNIAR